MGGDSAPAARQPPHPPHRLATGPLPLPRNAAERAPPGPRQPTTPSPPLGGEGRGEVGRRLSAGGPTATSPSPSRCDGSLPSPPHCGGEGKIADCSLSALRGERAGVRWVAPQRLRSQPATSPSPSRSRRVPSLSPAMQRRGQTRPNSPLRPSGGEGRGEVGARRGISRGRGGRAGLGLAAAAPRNKRRRGHVHPPALSPAQSRSARRRRAPWTNRRAVRRSPSG